MSLSLAKLTHFKSAYDVLGYLLRLMSQIWHRKLNAELATIDLTEMQFVLMMGLGWLIEKHPEGISQRELAEACGCSTALASQVLRKLTDKKLILIGNDALDARARKVRLSKAGEKKLEAACLILERMDEEFRSDDPQVAQNLFDALRAAIDVKLKYSTQPDSELGAMPLNLEEPETQPARRASRRVPKTRREA